MVSRRQDTSPKAAAGRWRRLVRRLLIWVRGAVLVLLALLVVLVALLAWPGGRVWLLQRGLDLAQDQLPGRVSVGRMVWSDPGRLELQDVLWTTSPDGVSGQAAPETLAVVPRLLADVDLKELAGRRLYVRRLGLELSRADGPLIMKTLESAAAEAPGETTAAPDSLVVPFLEAGYWPGLPWARVDSVHVQLAGVDLPSPEGQWAMRLQRLDLQAGADLADEDRPGGWLRLARLEVALLQEDDTVQATVRDFSARYWHIPGAQARLEMGGHFILPAPSALTPMLPADFPLSELPGQESCRGQLSLQVEHTSDFRGLGPARLDLALDGNDWLQRGRLRATADSTRVHVDTLDLAFLGIHFEGRGWAEREALEWQGAFGVRDSLLLGPLAGPRFEQSRVLLEGNISASGAWRDPQARLEVQASVLGPGFRLPRLDLAAGRTTSDLELTARLKGAEMPGTVQVDSLDLRISGDGALDRLPNLQVNLATALRGGAEELPLALDLQARVSRDSLLSVAVDSLRARVEKVKLDSRETILIQADPERSRYSLTGLSLTSDLGDLELAGSWQPGHVRLQGGWDLLFPREFLERLAPGDIWSRDGGLDLSCLGQLELDSEAAQNQSSSRIELAALPRGEAPELRLISSLTVDPGREPGLLVGVDLKADDRIMLQASVQATGHQDTLTGLWLPDPLGEVRVEIPHQDLPLAPFLPLLPSSFAVRGQPTLQGLVSLQPEPTGPPRGRLDVGLATGPLELDLPQGSRARVQADVQVQGQLAEPVVTGQITIVDGLLRIPEMPPSLLPVQGNALLLSDGRDSLLARGAGLDLTELASEGQGLSREPPPPLPELDLKILLPGDFRVRGFGLDTELTGDLRVKRGYDEDGVAMPVLRGHVAMAEGSFKFMNHQFQFEDSEILFQEKAPADPELRVTLATTVSGIVVRVEARGTALEPDIRLSSEPELEQSDIMSLLLFGQTSSDLDPDQRQRMGAEPSAQDQLRRNLAGLAMVLGTSNIQDSLGASLGLDMVELGAEEDGGNLLTVGKFLTPRVLLKYNQSLEKGGAYFMTLDYSLSRFFKLVSTYGQGEEESGVELKWTRRY